MKEFRVAKCLVDGEINEYAIFADGSRKKIIQTNDKYGKYFEVDNELNTDCKSFCVSVTQAESKMQLK